MRNFFLQLPADVGPILDAKYNCVAVPALKCLAIKQDMKSVVLFLRSDAFGMCDGENRQQDQKYKVRNSHDSDFQEQLHQTAMSRRRSLPKELKKRNHGNGWN